MLRERPLGHFVVAPDEAALSGGAVFLYAERELKKKIRNINLGLSVVFLGGVPVLKRTSTHTGIPPFDVVAACMPVCSIRCGRHLQRPFAVLAHALWKRLRSDLRTHSTGAPSARGPQRLRPLNLKRSAVSMDLKHGDRK